MLKTQAQLNIIIKNLLCITPYSHLLRSDQFLVQLPPIKYDGL